MTADDWNTKYPPGTPVLYESVRGDTPFATKTRSEAWELGHGAPVVKIEGRTGGVLLSHLTIGPFENADDLVKALKS